jgi:hypothetical protein
MATTKADEAKDQAKAAKPEPCTCTEVEAVGGPLPCPSCKAKGLRAWEGKGVKPAE